MVIVVCVSILHFAATFRFSSSMDSARLRLSYPFVHSFKWAAQLSSAQLSSSSWITIVSLKRKTNNLMNWRLQWLMESKSDRRIKRRPFIIEQSHRSSTEMPRRRWSRDWLWTACRWTTMMLSLLLNIICFHHQISALRRPLAHILSRLVWSFLLFVDSSQQSNHFHLSPLHLTLRHNNSPSCEIGWKKRRRIDGRRTWNMLHCIV